jgi:Trypsin
VALIKLQTPVNITTFPVIKVNSQANLPADGDTLELYGFGRTSTDGPPSTVLKTLSSTYQACGSENAYMHVFADSSSGICFGDSGGPAVIGDTLYGVASFVRGGCAAGLPDGYARVSSYYGWIEGNVCAIGSDTTNFDCTLCGSLRSLASDRISSLVFGVQRSFQTVSSFLGFGTGYDDHDILIFPMGEHL